MLDENAFERGYGVTAKVLHWVIVALLIAQFAIAWTMPGIGPRTQPDTLINLHLSVGTLILLVLIVRLAWRSVHPVPLATDGAPGWQKVLARVTHFLLYALLALIPVLGWASASGRGFPVTLFGLFRLPGILPLHSSLTSTLGDIHSFTSYVLLGVVGLHVTAALYHHFVIGDRTLRRMLPGQV